MLISRRGVVLGVTGSCGCVVAGINSPSRVVGVGGGEEEVRFNCGSVSGSSVRRCDVCDGEQLSVWRRYCGSKDS